MERQTELDWLRGLMLVLMTMTHLPTWFSAHAGQPFAVEFKNVYLKAIKPENLPATPLPVGQGRGGQ